MTTVEISSVTYRIDRWVISKSSFSGVRITSVKKKRREREKKTEEEREGEENLLSTYRVRYCIKYITCIHSFGPQNTMNKIPSSALYQQGHIHREVKLVVQVHIVSGRAGIQTKA